MTESFFSRTQILIGDAGLQTLADKHVLIAGLGGVGGFAAEAIARAGVGKLTIIDNAVVSPSNLNRQLLALRSTLGQSKTEVMKARLLDINPDIDLVVVETFLSAENAETLLLADRPDYVADCIDSIACKAELVAACLRNEIAVMSSMGAGNRIDPLRIKVTRLNQTHTDGLARGLRRRLKSMGVPPRLKVVFSDELPSDPLPHQPLHGNAAAGHRAVNGTISYMPALFGLILAGSLIKDLLQAE